MASAFVEPCPTLTMNLYSTPIHIQLLQKRRYDVIPFYQCHISLIQTIYYCGMHSHISVVTGGLSTRIIEVTRKECYDIHQSLSYKIRSWITLDGLKINSTSHHSITIIGSVSAGGWCQGETYSYGGVEYSSAVVLAAVKVTLKTGFATLDMEDDSIILPSGTRCIASKESGIDSSGGYTYWDVSFSASACSPKSYDVLFEGTATQITSKEPKRIVVVVNDDDISFALEVKLPKIICQQSAFSTEHPQLYIAIRGTFGFYFEKTTVLTLNVNMAAYYNSKFVYIEKHIKGQIEQLYIALSQQKCELEQTVMHNLLSLASISVENFAYALTKEPGHTALVRGEIIHIIDCVPVEIVLRAVKTCYVELPITFKNQSMFMAPKTRLLMKLGTEVECNPLFPAMYKLDQTWYSVHPTLTRAEKPNYMSPSKYATWSYISPSDLAISGIYSTDELDRLQRHMMLPSEKAPIENIIIRTFDGQKIDHQTLDIKGFLTEANVESLTSTIGKKLWGVFYDIGNFMSGILGIYLCLRIFKYVLSSIMNGVALYRAFGFSYKLLACIWSNFSTFVLNLKFVDKAKELLPISIIPPKTEEEEPIAGPSSPCVPTLEDLQQSSYLQRMK